MLGDAMFYGQGAGKLPTASAVAGDVVDCARHIGKNIPLSWGNEKLNLMDTGDVKHRFFVRIQGSLSDRLPAVEAAFGQVETITVPGIEGEFAFITGEMPEAAYRDWGQKRQKGSSI